MLLGEIWGVIIKSEKVVIGGDFSEHIGVKDIGMLRSMKALDQESETAHK